MEYINLQTNFAPFLSRLPTSSSQSFNDTMFALTDRVIVISFYGLKYFIQIKMIPFSELSTVNPIKLIFQIWRYKNPRSFSSTRKLYGLWTQINNLHFSHLEKTLLLQVLNGAIWYLKEILKISYFHFNHQEQWTLHYIKQRTRNLHWLRKVWWSNKVDDKILAKTPNF